LRRRQKFLDSAFGKASAASTRDLSAANPLARMIDVPSAPGFGFELDWDFLKEDEVAD